MQKGGPSPLLIFTSVIFPPLPTLKKHRKNSPLFYSSPHWSLSCSTSIRAPRRKKKVLWPWLCLLLFALLLLQPAREQTSPSPNDLGCCCCYFPFLIRHTHSHRGRFPRAEMGGGEKWRLFGWITSVHYNTCRRREMCFSVLFRGVYLRARLISLLLLSTPIFFALPIFLAISAAIPISSPSLHACSWCWCCLN